MKPIKMEITDNDVFCLDYTCTKCPIRLAATKLANVSIDTPTGYCVGLLNIPDEAENTACRSFLDWYNARVEKMNLWDAL